MCALVSCSCPLTHNDFDPVWCHDWLCSDIYHLFFILIKGTFHFISFIFIIKQDISWLGWDFDKGKLSCSFHGHQIPWDPIIAFFMQGLFTPTENTDKILQICDNGHQNLPLFALQLLKWWQLGWMKISDYLEGYQRNQLTKIIYQEPL